VYLKDMAFKIDAKIIARCHMCNKGLSCLTGEVSALCPVDKFISREGREAVFVKCEETEYCNFRIPFGMCGHGCTCPVRIEIFKRYGK